VSNTNSLPVDELEQVTSMAKRTLESCSKMFGRDLALFTYYMLLCGMAFARAKEIVKGRKENWGDYVHVKIPKSSQSTVNDYILLSEIPYILHYSLFGKQRLIWLHAVIDMKKDNPIGAFLTEYQIQFDPEGNQEPQEFKTAIDTAISMKRLQKAGINGANIDFIRYLIGIGGKPVSNGLIRDLTAIQKSGGDINKLLQELCLNNGASSPSDAPTAKMQHINELSKKVSTVLKSLDIQTVIRQADRALIQDAVTELNKVLALMNN